MDGKERTRNCICALRRVIDESITCTNGEIRVNLAMTLGRVVVGEGL